MPLLLLQVKDGLILVMEMHSCLHSRLLSMKSCYIGVFLWSYLLIEIPLCVFMVRNVGICDRERVVEGSIATSPYINDDYIMTIKMQSVVQNGKRSVE